MPTEVTRFKCIFCKRLFAKKQNAIWHEENRCLHNPIQRACITCDHFHGSYPKEDGREHHSDESIVICTNKLIPYEKDCERWDERTPQWQHWLISESKIQSKAPEDQLIDNTSDIPF
ncbi:MAG: hypothetical protein WC341_00465 [Bacteroidales bacterium]|jgi:hypothetical protein